MANDLGKPCIPDTFLQQNGDRSVAVFGNESVIININHGPQDIPGQPSARQMMDVASFSTDYYQLIVTTQDDLFEKNVVHMMASRSLSAGYVPDAIFESCSTLTPEGKRSLKRIPAIICNECANQYGKPGPGQMAAYARITQIFPQNRIIDIHFEPIAVFPQSLLCDKEAASFFGLEMDCCVTTLNRTAWWVIERDIFYAFERVGLGNLPRPNMGARL